MKVAVVHNLLRGGAHRRLREQLQRLDCETIEFCLASATPVSERPHLVDYRACAPARPPALRPPLRYLDLAHLAIAWRKLAAAVERSGADAVYANPCRYLQTPTALLWLRLPSLYFCDEPRRIDYEAAAKKARNSRTQLPYAPLYASERALDRRAVKQATRLATNSRYTATMIWRAYAREADVVPMGVPDDFTKASFPPRHLLSVGTLIPDKGHELAIEAAALARGPWPVLVVAPRPDDREEARLRRLAAELGVALDVRVGISDEALREAYQSAYATFFLARAEPFGLAAVEAQACGSPAIVAAEGGLPETIREGKTGWAVPRSAAAAADKVALLTRDAALRQRMAREAAAHGAESSWTRSAEAVKRLLDEVCASPS